MRAAQWKRSAILFEKQELVMTTRTKKTLAALCAFGAVALSSALTCSDAQAADQKGVITINEVTIVGRVQKPVASVDVSKIQPKLTLAELRQPFIDRIEEATRSDPF
jgi:hypothetical protein